MFFLFEFYFYFLFSCNSKAKCLARRAFSIGGKLFHSGVCRNILYAISKYIFRGCFVFFLLHGLVIIPPLPLYPTPVDVAVDRGLNGMAPEQSDEESTRSFGHVQVPRRVSSLTPVETFSSDHDNTPLRPGDEGFGAKSPLLHPLSAQDDQEASIAHGPVSSASSGLSGPSPLSNGLRSNELDGLNGSRHGVASDKGSAALGGAGRRDRDMLVSGRADSPEKSTGDIDLEDLYGAYF